MEWRKRHALILSLFLLSFVSVFLNLTTFVHAVPPPHAIYGYVTYNGKPIAGVEIEAINDRTGDILKNVTDKNGGFLIEIGNYPNGWENGDKIIFKAKGKGEYECLEGYKEIFVDETEIPQREDISLYLSLTARFTYTPTDPKAGEKISFTDLSAGIITNYTWDFGDGNISYEKNPTHVYNKEGTYNVTFTVFCHSFSTHISKEIEVLAKEEEGKETPGFVFTLFVIAFLLAMFKRKKCISQ